MQSWFHPNVVPVENELEGSAKNTNPASVEARYSRKRLVRALWIGAGGTALCTLIAFGHLTGSAPGIIVLIAAYCGIFIFGLGALRFMVQLVMRSDEVAITVNSDGIRDRRVAAEIIPWAAISDVTPLEAAKPSLWPFGNREYKTFGMFLHLRPGCEASLGISWTTRVSKVVNGLLGVSGIYIDGAGLDVDCDELLRLSLAYLKADHRI